MVYNVYDEIISYKLNKRTHFGKSIMSFAHYCIHILSYTYIPSYIIIFGQLGGPRIQKVAGVLLQIALTPDVKFIPIITIFPFTSIWKLVKRYIENTDLAHNTQGQIYPCISNIVILLPQIRVYSK